jgi:hypothetical protein
VIFNPIKKGLNYIAAIDNNDARRRLCLLHLPYSQRPRQLMFPETSGAAHQVTRRKRESQQERSRTWNQPWDSNKWLKNSAKFKRNLKVAHYVTFLKQLILFCDN